MTDWSPVVDFDAAYDNSGAVPNSADYLPRWAREAAAFREVLRARGHAELDQPYGPHERQRFDLFRPEREVAAGLIVFVHGGYWKALDKSVFSHLSRGALAQGFTVAMPSYRLAPEVGLGEIAEDIARCLADVSARIGGAIRLAGHSAGGHLVARMIASDTPVPGPVLERIELVLPISGLHDLRPIRRTRMNDILSIDRPQAMRESPALLEPVHACRIHAVVGSIELPELRRQTTFLASAWAGLGARVDCAEIEGRHHFDVVEDLCDPSSRLTRLLTAGASL